LTGNYAYGPTVDQSRVIDNPAGGGTPIAYDPVSSNLVGNGDLTLGTAGWEANPFASDPFAYSNHSVQLTPGSGLQLRPVAANPYELRQFLQIPTPDDAMVLAFTYGLTQASTANLSVYLAGELVASITPTDFSAHTFQTTITDPALENLDNAELRFQDTGIGTLYLSNFSLTAVPEPASAGLIGLACSSLLLRQRGSCKS
jgi:hypothetical protein